MSMLSTTSNAQLEAFVRAMAPAQMADLLLELCTEHEAVHHRLQRMMLADNPERLAADFRRSLDALRDQDHYGYRESQAYGLALKTWLSQVEREVLPMDPAVALALAEGFIESDEAFFNRADDSLGVIGDAIRAGCRLWLKAAAACEDPGQNWPRRLDALASADQYGTREGLYRHAGELLDEPALRQLVEHHMARLEVALSRPDDAGQMPVGVFSISGTLLLLSQALCDPEVHVRAVLAYSPQPYARQMEGFVREFLECGRPADALNWLEQDWGASDSSRQRLLATALGQLGRDTERGVILQRLFENTLSVHDLNNWMQALPLQQQARAATLAREWVAGHPDPTVAALVLVATGAHALAEAVLLAAPDKINGHNYGELVPLAQALEAQARWAGATAVYRALLEGILNRAYARAYGHAAEYWAQLNALAESRPALGRLMTHETYVAEIRRKHARKVSFWAYVNGSREMPASKASLGAG